MVMAIFTVAMLASFLVPYEFFSYFFEKNLVKALMPAYRSSPVLV